MTTEGEPNASLLPGWDVVRRDFIEPGLPGRVVVGVDPKVELFVDQDARRFGAILAMPSGASVPPSPFVDLDIAEVRAAGIRCVEISTQSASLFGTFYLFAVDIARAVVERGMPPTAALEASLAQWRALLQTSSLLSEEKQLGLAGELWLLDRLTATLGPAALDAWVGPGRQTHDFRLGSVEFEVKATTGGRRVHMINGLHQLTATPGSTLYLLSARYADGGTGGETLRETVERLEVVIGAAKRRMFADKLAAAGYRAADAAHYGRRRRLADPVRLIRVEDGVPRLTAEALAMLPPSFATGAVSDLSYRIDVDELGFADGTPDFAAVLPTNE